MVTAMKIIVTIPKNHVIVLDKNPQTFQFLCEMVVAREEGWGENKRLATQSAEAATFTSAPDDVLDEKSELAEVKEKLAEFQHKYYASEAEVIRLKGTQAPVQDKVTELLEQIANPPAKTDGSKEESF